MEDWIVGSEPSERFPLWTRANVGEVFPDPVAPLTYTLMMRDGVEYGWRDALAKTGAFTLDEFAPDAMETVGIFGGYTYLNASIFRIFGERGPGMTAQDMDDGFFGAQPGIPPYVPAEGDANEERTADMGACFEWVMTTPDIDYSHTSRERMDGLHQQRPNLDSMSNTELWAYAKGLMLTHFRQLFMEHIYTTFLSNVPVGALGQICAAVGRPADTMKIISGVGDVESAAPAMAMWQLGRQVAANPSLMAAFDAGLDGLYERLAQVDNQSGDSGPTFRAAFDQFIDEFGFRGPNEWEMREHSWETRPILPLAAIDRMRLSPEDAAPAGRNAVMAAERARLIEEISALLAGDPETQGMFQAASNAAGVFNAGRERTKTNNIMLINEVRVAIHTVGRRVVADGHCDLPGDIGLLLADEIDDWIADPTPFKTTIAQRRALAAEYAALQEPFVFYETQPAVTTWSTRADVHVDAVAIGDVLTGVSGCPGTVTGTARVITDPSDPTALGPGEILVAPSTDPSWTPLFVPAGGVIVDVGAPQSHAMIVSRELGIPCVPSITNATRRIPDGATVEVNGDTGQVTILALP